MKFYREAILKKKIYFFFKKEIKNIYIDVKHIQRRSDLLIFGANCVDLKSKFHENPIVHTFNPSSLHVYEGHNLNQLTGTDRK